MSQNTIISVLLTGVLLIGLYMCIRKFLSVGLEKQNKETNELNSRIMKNWLEIYNFRNDNNASVESLTAAFNSMDQLHRELLNQTETASHNRNKTVFLHSVKIESVEASQKS